MNKPLSYEVNLETNAAISSDFNFCFVFVVLCFCVHAVSRGVQTLEIVFGNRYMKNLAAHFLDGTLKDDDLRKMSDEEVMRVVCGVKGIGEWSCHMFMMFQLGRPDILPVGDLAIRKAFKRLCLFLHTHLLRVCRSTMVRSHKAITGP